MAKEYDVYLRNRLTECDLLVYSIAYHDGITVTGRMILEAALHSYLLHKFAAAQMESKVAAHIDDMIKLCLEKLSIASELGAAAEFKSFAALYTDRSQIAIDANITNTLERVLNRAESGLLLAVQPLDTQISLSTGRTNFPLRIGAHVEETLKHSLIRSGGATIPNAEISEIHQTDYLQAEAPAVIRPSLTNLCYQLTATASAAIEIVAMVLGTEVRHSLGRWYSGIVADAKVGGTWAQKFITVQTVANILQEAAGVLDKIVYPAGAPVSITLSDLPIEKKRHRMLSEMDSSTLADFDEMSIEDLDYVLL